MKGGNVSRYTISDRRKFSLDLAHIRVYYAGISADALDLDSFWFDVMLDRVGYLNGCVAQW